jgi:uncharacterized protein
VSTGQDLLDLVDYRRRVGDLYRLPSLEDWRAGMLSFELEGVTCRLTVLSLIAYGGGLFLPFKDATSGPDTYGGGRYLFDTAKGTDGLVLGVTPGSAEVIIDFNFAYNPSCAYSPRWACPLAPPENTLPVAVTAGEKRFAPIV